MNIQLYIFIFTVTSDVPQPTESALLFSNPVTASLPQLMVSSTIERVSSDVLQPTESVLPVSVPPVLPPVLVNDSPSEGADQNSVEIFSGIAVGVVGVFLGIVFIVVVVGAVMRKRKVSHNAPSPRELKENPAYGEATIRSTNAAFVNPLYGASGK